MVDVKEFHGALVAEGLDFFAGVPDSLLKNFCAYLSDNAPADRHFITANEGAAIGMACGYHLSTGRSGVVYMQNSGEGNTVNPLLSIADPDVYSIPMMLVIGWRGQPGVHDEPQHVKQGKVTCDLLEAMGIDHCVMDPGSWRTQLEKLAGAMREGSKPVALVVPKGTFNPYPFKPEDNGTALSREDALGIIIDELSEDDFIVSTTGKTSREVFEIRETRGEGHANDFLTVGGMGHASSIAFGAALGTDKNIWCIDGDGAFLMHMGALALAAQSAPANFKYILNNNGAHESVGGQPTIADEIDVPAILKAFGFGEVAVASTEEEISQAMRKMREGSLRALVMHTHQGSRADLGRPTTTPQQNKRDMMAKLGAGGAQ